jgi:hypothetical protein
MISLGRHVRHRWAAPAAAIAGAWLLMGLSAPEARAVGVADPRVDTIDGTQAQGKRIVIKLRAGAAEVVSVAAGGHVRQGAKNLPLRRATATAAAGSRALLELRPRRSWQERRIKRALARGRTLKATVRVRFRDILGNVARRTRTVKLVGRA